MGNSKLVDYTKISPNKNSPRNNSIKRITIHHMAGNASIETCGNIFANSSRAASSNYGIGSDGRVGMYVEEKDRSWCSCSGSNDHQAITIEVANDGGAPQWHVSDKALAKLIELCADICKRYGKKKLLWFGDRDKTLSYTPKSDEMVITIHKWFAATGCPGPYLESKLSYIAKEVTKLLSGTVENSKKPTSTDTNTASKVKGGDIVKITGNRYYDGKFIPSWVKALKWIVYSVSGNKVILNQDENKKYAIMSPVKISDVVLVKASSISATKPKAYKQGDAITLKSAPLYVSASATTSSSRKSGTYYLYDGDLFNGRYRITKYKSFCGKKPVGVFVTGYVRKSDIK